MIDPNSKDVDGNGEWGKVIKDALIQIHSIVLPDGKVLAFGTDGVAGDYDARFVYSIYDPVTGELKVLPNTTGTNIFCSNMAIDPTTGNVVIMGGDNNNTGQGGGTWSGRNDVVLFDYTTQTIRNISETDTSFALKQARWYGTTVTLSNGEILIVGGRDEKFDGSTFAEIYNSKTGMRQLSGTEIKDFRDGEGTLTGTYYYPHAWQIADGSVIIIEAGGTTNANHDIYRMTVGGNGSVAKIGVLPFDTRNLTGSIMYAPDQVLVASTTGQVWKADLSQATIKWEIAFTIKDEDGPGLVARTNGSFIMLPDGRVAMVGGSSSAGVLADSMANAQKSVLFWDPATGKMEYSAQQDLARMYHSTGLLLPDGTIYSAGSGSPGPQENANFQILSPAYLYDKDGTINEGRPQIAAAPRNVDSGSTFRITVDDTSDIGKITAIKSGATTHARAADTRFVALDYKIIDGNTIEVTLPRANIAIPGAWMLFAVDKAGVPSTAKMIGIDMVPLVDTGSMNTGPTVFYNIDAEQIDGAFALAVTVRFDDVNGGHDQKVFDLGNGTADSISFGQVGGGTDVEFVITQGGQTYRVVAQNAIVQGETATWRVGVDPTGTMRITKNDDVVATGQGVVPADIDRSQYLIGQSSDPTDSKLIGLIRDLKIANYGNFAELDPGAEASPCAKTGEAVCLCGLLVPDVDDTPGNDAPKVFEKYSILASDITELTNGSVGENKTVLTATGIIAFADADAEPHLATVSARGANYLGDLTIGKATTAVGAKTGSVTWNFKVNDAALDKLEQGQELVQLYDITLDDGHGGVTTQAIAITLRGSNDAGPPTEAEVVVVPTLATTAGNDAIELGDNVRLMAGANLQGGSNSLKVGNYFDLRNGNLDFGTSRDAASFTTGANAKLNGNDVLMGAGGVRNTVAIGADSSISLVRMDGNGVGTVNSLTIGDRSISDAGIDMDGAGTVASSARMSIALGDGVRLGGAIDADGAYAVKTFVFGANVTVNGALLLNGAQNVNTVTAGDNFTLNGAYTGSATGADTLTIGKDWSIAGAVNLNGGNDTLAIGLSKVDPNVTVFSGGVGEDRLVLTIEGADLASFETAARAAGWTSTGGDQWRAPTNLTWRGMTFTAFETAEIKIVGGNNAPVIVADGTTDTGTVAETVAGSPVITHMTNGTILFDDKNIGDTHSVSITPRGANFLGTLDYVQPRSAQFGLLPWVFSVSDAALDPLAQGEVRTQTYDVVIRDDNGGVVTHAITLTLTGTNDAPVVAAAGSTLAGAVVELADGSAGENLTVLRATGDILFTDADVKDVHGASVVPAAAGYRGTFAVAPAGSGRIGWTFDVADGALDGLAAGEVVQQSYAVTIDDGHGGTVARTVVVTLTGAADSGLPGNITIAALKTGAGDDAITLGNGVTLSQGAVFGGGANSLVAGDNFKLSAGGLNFNGSTGAASLTLGANADLSGGDIAMTSNGVASSVAAGEGSKLSGIVMNGGGARASQTLDLGNAVVTDAAITINGAGVVADRMETVVRIGDDARTGGGIAMNGYYTTKDLTIGDRATIGGAIGLNGASSTAQAKIGSDVTIKGTLTGSAGNDVIEIGRGWQIDGAVDLNAGDDTLRIGGTTRDAAGTFTGGVGRDTLDLMLTADQLSSFESAASAARWVKTADGGWDTQGRALNWQGNSYTAFEVAKVTLVGGAGAALATVIGELQASGGNDEFILGSGVTLSQGAVFGGGANSLVAGDSFKLSAGGLNFNGSTGAASLTLGANADLSGGDIAMTSNGVASSVAAGEGSKLSGIVMNGGGARASQTLDLGKAVVTDAAITINGAGIASDRMETTVRIGDDVRTGGGIAMNGYYTAKDLTIGDRATIGGAVGLNGASSTAQAKIGSDVTIKGALTGSAGNDVIEIGRGWQIDGAVDLNAGDDTLRIGTTTRDAAGTFTGGAGRDTLDLVLTADQLSSFESAASAARWVKTADGGWDTQGRALNWQGNSYTAFEVAKVTLTAPESSLLRTAASTAGVLTQATAAGTTITGSSGDDFIAGTARADMVEGGAGRDTFALSGKPADYRFARNADGSFDVTSAADGHDVLRHVEDVFFHGTNETVPIDQFGH